MSNLNGQANLSLVQRRERRSLEQNFRRFVEKDFGMFNELSENEIIDLLRKIKLNVDGIQSLFEAFPWIQNREIKDKLAIGLLYWSLGSTGLTIHSFKIMEVLTYLVDIPDHDLNILLSTGGNLLAIKAGDRREQLARAGEFIANWKRFKSTSGIVSKLLLAHSANDDKITFKR